MKYSRAMNWLNSCLLLKQCSEKNYEIPSVSNQKLMVNFLLVAESTDLHKKDKPRRWIKFVPSIIVLQTKPNKSIMNRINQ